MQVIEIENQAKWDDFVGSQPQAQFAQSWEWGDFQASQVGRVWRLAVEDRGRIIAAAKFVKKTLFWGKSYFYCDRGPIFVDNESAKEALGLLLNKVQEIASQEQVIFFRIDSVCDLNFLDLNLQKTINVQPQKTAIIDLQKTEDSLLSAMHQKTRYNIRLAQKKGVVVELANTKNFEEFWSLMEETKERDEFNLHDKDYYFSMIGLNLIKLYFAKLDGVVIATSIVSYYGDMATYVHGGSSNKNREVMAPFLLQWTAMLDAKKAGLKYYDFYGVDEVKWPGVTRFKMGFSPTVFEYFGTHDQVYNQAWYNVYKWLRNIRRRL